MKGSAAATSPTTIVLRGALAWLLLSACTARIPANTPEAGATPIGREVQPVSLPGVTAAPAASATPQPTPTPTPLQWVLQGGQQLRNGDYDGAINTLRTQSQVGGPGRSLALQTIALAHLNKEDYKAALATLELQRNEIGVTLTNTLLTGHILDLDGQVITATRFYASAAGSAGFALAPYAQLWLGDALLAQKRYTQAAPAFRAAVNGAAGPRQRRERLEKLAFSQQAAGAFAQAIASYDEALGFERDGAVNARLINAKAEVLRVMGRASEANGLQRKILDEYPKTFAAFNAVTSLIANNQVVDELVRGQVNYYNNTNAQAQAAFVRAINTPNISDTRIIEIQYWAGLNYMAMGNWQAAHRNLDLVIAAGPKTTRFADALLDKADAYMREGNYSACVTAYRDFAQRLPNSPDLQQALRGAAIALDRAGNLEGALDAYYDAYKASPTSDWAQALYLRHVALSYAFNRKPQTALQSTGGPVLVNAPPQNAPDPSREATLWRGKSLLANDPAQAKAVLEPLAQGNDFVAIRARELLAGARPFAAAATPLFVNDAPTGNLAEALNWLSARTAPAGSPVQVNEAAARAALLADVRWQRGSALWQLGFVAEANDEFNSLWFEKRAEAVTMLLLADALRGITHYRFAIGAAEDALRAAKARDIAARSLPRALAELIYPVHFADLVNTSAREFNLDPMLVYSLIRQESLFDASAFSSAAANGLMQVIPSTGKEINQRLNWPPGYRDRDLAKGYVSVRFGSSYLSLMRQYAKGDWYTALTGYNAGIGRGLRWQEQSKGDPDVFYETISIAEPKLYVKRLVENYAAYRELYGNK